MKNIINELNKINRRGYSFSNVFSDWLDLMLYSLLALTKHRLDGKTGMNIQNKYNDEYLKIINKYSNTEKKGEREADFFAKAYAEFLIALVNEKDKDILGDIYMEYVSSGHNGQFFTPVHISDMMAEIAGDIKDDSRVLDPTCGSGVMLISASKVNKKAKLTGIDLDQRCAKMAVLNLCYRNLSGVIGWGNSLTGEMFMEWRMEKGFIIQIDNPKKWEIKVA